MDPVSTQTLVNRNNSSINGRDLLRDYPRGQQVYWNGNNLQRDLPEGFKITLFADHGCPFAHRAYITLHELGLPYEDVLVDLNKPREEWYLRINPRGLVPSLHIKYGAVDALVTESDIITQCLVDGFPSHLSPAKGSIEAALFRARTMFFVNTWITKVHDRGMQQMRLQSEEQKEALVDSIVETIKTEIEPLLENAAPFFGGSAKPTLAEILVGVFVLRAHAYSRNGLTRASIHQKYSSCPVYWKWAQAVMEIPSFHVTWDEATVLPNVRKRMAEHRKKMQKNA